MSLTIKKSMIRNLYLLYSTCGLISHNLLSTKVLEILLHRTCSQHETWIPAFYDWLSAWDMKILVHMTDSLHETWIPSLIWPNLCMRHGNHRSYDFSLYKAWRQTLVHMTCSLHETWSYRSWLTLCMRHRDSFSYDLLSVWGMVQNLTQMTYWYVYSLHEARRQTLVHMTYSLHETWRPPFIWLTLCMRLMSSSNLKALTSSESLSCSVSNRSTTYQWTIQIKVFVS